GVGLAGVAFSSPLIVCKALDDDGGGTDADVAACIRWVHDEGAKVISMSLGGSASRTIAEAVRYTWAAGGRAGSVLVAAAGNDGTAAVEYPAGRSEVVSVAAVDASDAVADFSNHNADVDLAALGAQRGDDVAPVPGGVVAGQDERREGPLGIGGRREPAHRARGEGAVVLAHVAVAVAAELDDPPLARRAGRELLVVDGLGRGDVEDRPAGVAQALAEVDLVGVDEEVGVEPADPGARLAPHEQRGGVRPVDLADRVAGALHVAARQPDGA